jgi:hypothetical protein
MMNWKGCTGKLSWSNMWNYPGIILEELRKNHVERQHNQCFDRDSKRVSPKYKSEVLPLEAACSVVVFVLERLQLIYCAKTNK